MAGNNKNTIILKDYEFSSISGKFRRKVKCEDFISDFSGKSSATTTAEYTALSSTAPPGVDIFVKGIRFESTGDSQFAVVINSSTMGYFGATALLPVSIFVDTPLFRVPSGTKYEIAQVSTASVGIKHVFSSIAYKEPLTNNLEP